MIETIILVVINILTLLIGVKIGMSVANKKEITLNPIKAIQEHKEERIEHKEADLKDRQLKTMLKNIDNYDGSGLGQEEIPR